MKNEKNDLISKEGLFLLLNCNCNYAYKVLFPIVDSSFP